MDAYLGRARPTFGTERSEIPAAVSNNKNTINIRNLGAHPDEADNLEVFNEAVAIVNDRGGDTSIYVPDGNFQISAPIDSIIAPRSVVFGNGRSSKITNTGSTGRILQLGTTSDGARWSEIWGLSLECDNAPNNEHAIKVVDAADWRIGNLYLNDVAGVIELGDADGGAARGVMDGILAVIRDDNTNSTDWYLLNHSSQCSFVNCHTRGGHFWPYDVNNNSAYVKVASLGGSDGLTLSNFRCFCEPLDSATGAQVSNGTVGKPYGLYLDGTAESVNNLRVNELGMDGTHKAAIYFRGDSTVDTNRVHTFDQFRFETAAGVCVDYNVSGSGSNVTEIISFGKGRFVYGNHPSETDTPFTFSGTKMRGVTFGPGVTISEKGGAPARTQIFNMGINDWSIFNPSLLGSGIGDALNVSYVVTTTADVDRYTLELNPGGNTTTGYINHYAYGSASDKRVIRVKNQMAPRRVVHEVGGRFTTSGASATTYLLGYGLSDQTAVGANIAAASNSMIYYFHNPHYTVDGLTTKMMLRATISVAGTAPAQTITVGLYPATISGGNIVPGTVTSGSTATLTTPGSNAFTSAVSSTFTAPSNGVYIIGYTLSGTPSAACVLQAQLLLWNET